MGRFPARVLSRLDRRLREATLHDPSRPWLVTGLSNRRRDARTELRCLVYNRDNFRCQSCGRRFVSVKTLARDDFDYDGLHNIRGLTMGHIIPASKGGRWEPDNIKAQCERCNARLGDKVWTEFWSEEEGEPLW